MASDRSRRAQPVQMFPSQVGEAPHKNFQCTDVLKNALAGTSSLVLGYDDFEKTQKIDKSHIQMNLVLVDCLLDINSTELYNRSFLQDCLMFVDKLLAGRLSKALNSTRWSDDGSKLLHMCFMELRRIKRNTRTGERHAPWLKALLNKMTTEGNSLQEAKSQFFESRRSSSSSSVATGRMSFASRSPLQDPHRGDPC
jgi:hypothetical protein